MCVYLCVMDSPSLVFNRTWDLCNRILLHSVVLLHICTFCSPLYWFPALCYCCSGGTGGTKFHPTVYVSLDGSTINIYWLDIHKSPCGLFKSQQQRLNRIRFSNNFLASSFFFFFFESFISCINSSLMKTLRTPPHPSLDDNPMQQRLPAPDWMLVPLNLFANTYNHSRLRLVMSHKSFITSSLALKIIKFPFLLCVPLPDRFQMGDSTTR